MINVRTIRLLKMGYNRYLFCWKFLVSIQTWIQVTVQSGQVNIVTEIILYPKLKNVRCRNSALFIYPCIRFSNKLTYYSPGSHRAVSNLFSSKKRHFFLPLEAVNHCAITIQILIRKYWISTGISTIPIFLTRFWIN